MPRDHEPDEPETAEPPPGRGRFTLLRLSLRLAVASAAIAGLSLLALPALRRADPVDPAAQSLPQARGVTPMPAAPATASIASAPFASAALGTARLGLAEPGIDPVRVTPGRLDPLSGRREDALSRGAFDALEAPALRLTLTRGAGAARAPGLFVLLARRAADGPALSVMRTGGYGRIATKFGAVETLEVTLGGSRRRTCTGFVTRDAALRIDGWLCAPLGRPPEAGTLACTLDALSLDDPSDPTATRAFRGEGRRPARCDGPVAAADPTLRTGSIAGRADRSAPGRSIK